jgi:DegV family protein with EDD domain
MQIVTDGGADLNLNAVQCAELGIHVVPLNVTLDDKTYRGTADISLEAFYDLLVSSGSFPTTSQPSVGDFAALYRQLAATDPQILSIHMSSGLSGTLQAARAAEQLVPEARITYVDTKTLSAAAGWQVEAAARALKAGWAIERILALVARIGAVTDSVYTLDDLGFLIHGGRISHMKGLIASLLRIKPIIGVEKVNGAYEQLGQVRTFARALQGLVDRMARQHAPGSALRVQVRHAANPEGASRLRELLSERFDCSWLPTGPLSLVLGAHTGPSMVGVAYAPVADLPEMP